MKFLHYRSESKDDGVKKEGDAAAKESGAGDAKDGAAAASSEEKMEHWASTLHP